MRERERDRQVLEEMTELNLGRDREVGPSPFVYLSRKRDVTETTKSADELGKTGEGIPWRGMWSLHFPSCSFQRDFKAIDYTGGSRIERASSAIPWPGPRVLHPSILPWKNLKATIWRMLALLSMKSTQRSSVIPKYPHILWLCLHFYMFMSSFHN